MIFYCNTVDVMFLAVLKQAENPAQVPLYLIENPAQVPLYLIENPAQVPLYLIENMN